MPPIGAGPIPLQDLFGVNGGRGNGRGQGRGRGGRGRGRGNGGGRGRGRGNGGSGPVNNRGDAAAAAGNEPDVFIQNQLAQVMQRRNIDTTNLRDLLYNNLSARARTAFQYIPVPPPPALPAPAPPAIAHPAPATNVSIPSRIMELVALRTTYENTADLTHLAAGVTAQINALHNSMINQAE